jgi:hypothetical protein
MISLEETRVLLGRLAEGKTDAELAVIRQVTYDRVRSLMAAWELRREGNKEQTAAASTDRSQQPTERPSRPPSKGRKRGRSQ